MAITRSRLGQQEGPGYTTVNCEICLLSTSGVISGAGRVDRLSCAVLEYSDGAVELKGTPETMADSRSFHWDWPTSVCVTAARSPPHRRDSAPA
ncbi:hypothetical protein J6590_072539 [Homalodisca vitripennis]|nr:hypothetical protein J6590_072539 [Homalodisca vitripennis]